MVVEPCELVHRPLMCVRLPGVSTGTISQPELQTTAGKYGLKINLEQTANLAELYGPLGEAGGILQAQFVKRARCGHLLGSPACTQAWLTDCVCRYLMNRPATVGAAELERQMQPRVYPVPLVTAEDVAKVLGAKMSTKFKSVHKAYMKVRQCCSSAPSMHDSPPLRVWAYQFNPSRQPNMHPSQLRDSFEANFGIYMSDYEWAKLLRQLFDLGPNDLISYVVVARALLSHTPCLMHTACTQVSRFHSCCGRAHHARGCVGHHGESAGRFLPTDGTVGGASAGTSVDPRNRPGRGEGVQEDRLQGHWRRVHH